MVERLEVARMPPRLACATESVVPRMLSEVHANTSQDADSQAADSATEPTLHVLCRSLQQLEQVIAAVQNIW